MQKKFATRFVLSTGLLLGSLTANSQTTTGPTLIGLSSYIYTSEVDSTDPTTVTIYVGSTPGCTGGTSTTCTNSCSSLATITSPGDADKKKATAYACNDSGIHSNLQLSISWRGVTAENFKSTSKLRAFSNNTEIAVESQSTINPGVAPQTVTANLKWANILGSKLGTESTTVNFTVGVDPGGSDAADAAGLKEAMKMKIIYRFVKASPYQKNGCDSDLGIFAGFCEYYAYPGDGKIYVFNSGVFTDDTNPNLIVQKLDDATVGQDVTVGADGSGMTVGAIRVYFRESGDFSTFRPSDWDHTDLRLSGTKLSKKYVDGLTNTVSYSLMVATVDKGGNATYFFNPTTLDDTDSVGPNVALGTTQAATPEPVTGLLDNKNCFIATAAYGSGDAADVETLRQFRNSFLLNWEGGKSFVKFYYQHSPPIAKFIAEREWLKFMVRESLKPFVVVAKIAFNYGAAGLLVLFLGSILLFSGSIVWLRKGSRA